MADLLTLRKFETLSPFEIKDELIKLAKDTSRTTQSAFLNAGRGNPNWIATCRAKASSCSGNSPSPRASASWSTRPASAACRRPRAAPARLDAWLDKHADMPGAPFLKAMVPYAVKKVRLRAGRLRARAHRFDHRRQLSGARPHARAQRAHRARISAVGDVRRAAACRASSTSTRSRAAPRRCATSSNRSRPIACCAPGDTIALGTPIFTPYIEMTHLEDYDLKVVNIRAPQENRFQYTDEEIKKLEDPKIKAFFVVNPGNPQRHGDEQGDDRQDHHAGAHQAAGPDAADRRRLRHLRQRFPLAARRTAAQHHRRLFLFEVFRLHRLAARRHRRARGQHLRQDDRQAARCRRQGAGQALRAR